MTPSPPPSLPSFYSRNPNGKIDSPPPPPPPPVPPPAAPPAPAVIVDRMPLPDNSDVLNKNVSEPTSIQEIELDLNDSDSMGDDIGDDVISDGDIGDDVISDGDIGDDDIGDGDIGDDDVSINDIDIDIDGGMMMVKMMK